MSEQDDNDLQIEADEPLAEDFAYTAPTISSYDASLAQNRRQIIFNARQIPALLVALTTFANGLVGIGGPLYQRLVQHPKFFQMIVPYGVYHWSRALSTLFGFMLIYLSFNLLQRKRMSWLLALAGLLLSLLIHLARARMEYGSDTDFFNESLSFAVLPVLLNLTLLIAFRDRFPVKSELRKIKTGVAFFVICILLALAYGTLGFFLLDKRDFGLEFQLSDALLRTLREFLLIGNPDIEAQTRHAAWFLDSLRMTGGFAAVFACYSLFRPVEYQLRTRPRERELAAQILGAHGLNALDYYKLLPDKSYIFSASGNCLAAYKTVLGVAINLGDLVGPQDELPEFLKAFLAWCHENGWMTAFLQTGDTLLDVYKQNSLEVLKVGEDAIVDLDTFTSSTCKKKDFKGRVKKFEKDGYVFQLLKAPHDTELLHQLEEVSNEWLSLPGRRERGFSLGVFDHEILKNENIYAVSAADGKIIAFVNQVRSYAAGETSIDLMRHRRDVPNGCMDYLFVKLFLSLHEAGFKTFNLGLAALSGVGDKPGDNVYEKAVHLIYEHMNRFFSYKGLRNYKNKFEPIWQSRYLIYEGGPPGLLRTALAILEAGKVD